MIKFSVTKNGKALDPSLYNWDENTKTFSSKEEGLVLNFADVEGVTFNTSSYCTFYTSSSCTFNTGNSCAFDTGSYCTFNTGSYCTFDTGSYCAFDTGSSCAFKTNFNCTFEVGENCSLIRYDVKGVTAIPVNKKIKLNDHGIAGYTIIEEKKEIFTCNGKVVEIDGKKYQLTEVKE
jgi:hypothetical protein